jgi:peptidoglycan/xylan/chitin deacetylase (PgdA/CDA1 family)
MIFVTHGVISPYTCDRISHALCLPTSRAALHLQIRREKYVPLAQAIVGQGDALTVDDATYAGFELALLARRYGHAVSWFVNGSHVENKIQYFPFQISCMLDETTVTECVFDGAVWNLGIKASRRALRARIKQIYMRMRSQDEITDLIDKLAIWLRSESTNAEQALRTVTATELARAVLAGVDLQNHGWSHLNPQLLTETERAADIRQNDEYLALFRREITPVFAPAFGQRVLLPTPGHFMLLANRRLASAYKDGNVLNRGDLLLTSTHENRRTDVSPLEKDRLAA